MENIDFNANTGYNLKTVTMAIWLYSHLFHVLVQGQVLVKVLTDYGAFFLMTVTVLGYIYKNWLSPLFKKLTNHK